jgi:hypothetical protein
MSFGLTYLIEWMNPQFGLELDQIKKIKIERQFFTQPQNAIPVIPMIIAGLFMD